MRSSWEKSNDGSHPLEPPMRQTQIIFERLLKQIIEGEPLIREYWGYTFQSLVESDDSVLSTVYGPSGKCISIKSRYVIGCDGARSKVRSSAKIQSPRHTLYVYGSLTAIKQITMLTTSSFRPLSLVYVHFKTSDKDKMYSLGEFWHLTVVTGAIVISQDEVDTFTLHRIVPPGTDLEIEDPTKFVNDSLGGIGGPSDIKVEPILSGKWQADMSLADSFRSKQGRVFLAGDAGKACPMNILLQQY